MPGSVEGMPAGQSQRCAKHTTRCVINLFPQSEPQTVFCFGLFGSGDVNEAGLARRVSSAPTPLGPLRGYPFLLPALHYPQALEKLPPFDLAQLYRGINCKIAGYEEGKFVLWDAFSSTTSNPDVIKDFTGTAGCAAPPPVTPSPTPYPIPWVHCFAAHTSQTHPSRYPSLFLPGPNARLHHPPKLRPYLHAYHPARSVFIIRPKRSGHGRMINFLSEFEKEAEVLFNSNTWFRVNQLLGDGTAPTLPYQAVQAAKYGCVPRVCLSEAHLGSNPPPPPPHSMCPRGTGNVAAYATI